MWVPFFFFLQLSAFSTFFFTRSIHYLHNETRNKGLVLHFNGHPSRPKTVCSIVKFPLLSVKLCPKHDLEIVWQVKPTDDEGIIENRGVWDFFLGGGLFFGLDYLETINVMFRRGKLWVFQGWLRKTLSIPSQVSPLTPPFCTCSGSASPCHGTRSSRPPPCTWRSRTRQRRGASPLAALCQSCLRNNDRGWSLPPAR